MSEEERHGEGGKGSIAVYCFHRLVSLSMVKTFSISRADHFGVLMNVMPRRRQTKRLHKSNGRSNRKMKCSSN